MDDEIAKFQGVWKQIHCVADGVADPPDEVGSEPITTFSGNRYVVTLPDGTVVIEGTFRLYPGQEPKAVDWTDTCGTDRGKTFPAIYRFDGDRLIFCAADEGMERPKTFETRVGDTLRIHQRVVRAASMAVVDHRPHEWFLLRDDAGYVLDVNCSQSAVGFSVVLRLAPDEAEGVDARGHEAADALARRVQDDPAAFFARRGGTALDAAASAAIKAWLAASGAA